jgi:eukaryotic-like serine/threonine-protein kinase
MDPIRWKTVNKIFNAALELSPSDRAGFVAIAVEGDRDLQVEVEQLLRADADAGSYIESPIFPDISLRGSVPPVNTGDVLCGRFRIVRAVAEGGMGHVFEAFDIELAVRVALKVIRPEISSDPHALVRFRQEVRLARRITHPNVCRTFDFERAATPDGRVSASREVVFLTMEFLEGETLASCIERDGALPLDKALKIARQIANALQAAHTLGIVHRDMKPANVMLAPEVGGEPNGDRAVITDFGLARPDPLIAAGNGSVLSNTARPIGTLAYMAPEQLRGAQVCAATDVYAFGLILFEMATGKRAFPSDRFLSGIAQRLTGPAPDPKIFLPSLPEPWCRAIEGCLQTDPAERFPYASDAIAVLDGGRHSLPRQTLRALIAVWLGPRKLLWLSTILLAVLALLGGAFRLHQSRADSKVAPGALIYLTQVKNMTGEKALDNLTELIRGGLSQSAQVNLLDQGRVGDILQQMTKPPETAIDPSVAREIAMRAAAVRVVFATISGRDGNYKLDVDIQQPDNTPMRYRNHWTRSFAWHGASAEPNGSLAPELLAVIRAASAWIRDDIGESANDIARLDVPPEEVTTGNWQSLADYTQAESFARGQRYEDAVVILKDAVRLDPQFALAYARMGDLLLSLHRNVEGYRTYDKALDLGLRSRLSRREEDRIRGMRAADTWDYQLAVDAFRDYEIFYKNDYLGWIYPTYPLHMLGRDGEAVADLRQAVELAPTQSFAPEYLALEFLMEGRPDEAERWVSYLKQNNYSDYADEAEVSLAFLSHQYDRVARILSSMQSSSDSEWRTNGFRLGASVAAERSNYQEAIALLNNAIHEDAEQHGPTSQSGMLVGRAYLEMRIHDFARSVSDVRNALSQNPSPQTVLDADTVLGEGWTDAPSAFRAPIRDALATAERALPVENYGTVSTLAKLRTDGEILLTEGKPEEAVEVFKQAAVHDAPAGNREYLGRAYAAFAAKENEPKRARLALNNAMTAYAAIALHPAFVWWGPTDFPPGFYSIQLQRWLQIAGQLDQAGTNVQQAAQEASVLRGAP